MSIVDGCHISALQYKLSRRMIAWLHDPKSVCPCRESHADLNSTRLLVRYQIGIPISISILHSLMLGPRGHYLVEDLSAQVSMFAVKRSSIHPRCFEASPAFSRIRCLKPHTSHVFVSHKAFI